jgi:hypothetical protein
MQFGLDYQGEMFEDLKRMPFVFSDESRFCPRSDNRGVLSGTQQTTLWKRREDYLYGALAPQDKFPKFSIMIWGAIGIGFKSSLIVFDRSVTAETYLEEVKKDFIREANDVYGSFKWVLVQAGATCHTTPHNIDELTKECFVCPSWPPNSPGLNPIEMLWAIIKGRMRWDGIHNREEAITNIIDVWNGIDMSIINGLCLSFPRRIQLMIDARGETIQPLLSGNKAFVPDGYLSDRQHIIAPPPWQSHEDQFLIEKKQTFRGSWKQLAMFFPGKTACGVKNGWKILMTRDLNRRIRDNGASDPTEAV